jgi:hypothetical protein
LEQSPLRLLLGGGVDLPKLAEELAHLRSAMKSKATGKAEEDNAIGAIANAEIAATKGDGPAAIRYLKSAGSWALEVAKEIGVKVAAELLQKQMGSLNGIGISGISIVRGEGMDFRPRCVSIVTLPAVTRTAMR